MLTNERHHKVYAMESGPNWYQTENKTCYIPCSKDSNCRGVK